MRQVLLTMTFLAVFSTAAVGAVTHIVSYVDSHTITLGATETIVDVYKLTLDAGPGRTVGSIVLDIGTSAGFGGSEPFQVGYRTHSPVPPFPITDYLTPTMDDAELLLDPNYADPNYLPSDSNFLPPGCGDPSAWPTTTLAPTESNDGSIQGVVDDYLVGVGSLAIAKAVPVAYRTRVMDVAQVGVIRGNIVYGRSGSADDLGDTSMSPPNPLAFPEPTVLTLLGLGALALIRRRR